MAFAEHHEKASPKLVGKSASFDGGDGADQLVYQLVRVEEDGTVVPASEDEVIEMESYLEEGTAIQVSDAEGTQLCMADEEPMVCEQDSPASKEKNSLGSHDLDGLEAERKKLLAQLAFLDALLRKLKDEEQERTSLEAADNVVGYSTFALNDRGSSQAKQQNSACMDVYGRWDSKSDTNLMSSDLSDDFCQRKAVPVQQYTDGIKSKSRELESPSSTSKHNWTSTSNESLFKENSTQIGVVDDKRENSRDSDGDVLKANNGLDNLSIRELHEAFRTTFGRQTSVKDKQWLKRRISLGLGGLEVTSAEGALEESPVFSFTDASPHFVKPGTSLSEEQATRIFKSRQVADSRSRDGAVALRSDLESVDHRKVARNTSLDATSASFGNSSFLDHRRQSPWVSQQLTIIGESESFEEKDKMRLCREDGKRKRKPTKRYIEELAASDTKELIGKAAGVKDEKGELNIAKRTHFKDQEKQDPGSRLGISKVKFRTGYRKRRGCPSKTGSKCLTSNSSERAAQLVRKAISLRTSRASGNSTSTGHRVKIKRLPSDTSDAGSDSSTPSSNHGEANCNLPELNLPEGDTDIHFSTKLGSQKKHHHPWTLREVMKLLEGVSHCGVGKWADIKKYSFSYCIYRSSTDLKDKWRNLVRASNTHFKMVSQGEYQRKHSASPVPGPILVQVHELATRRCHSSLGNAASGMSRSGRSVSKKQLN